MSDEVLISVEHLSKRYRLGQIGATSLREGVERLWHRLRGRDPDVEMAVVGRGEIGCKKAPCFAEASQGKQDAQEGKGPRITPISANEEHRACPESSGQTTRETQEDRKQDLRSSEVSESGPLRGLRDADDSAASAIRADSRYSRETLSSPSSLRASVVDSSSQDLWALKDVSFEVKRGEVLGIIGRNGAGKSTLLKILTRITEPTSGRAILRGRVASLLEVGTGFHPELTGRENIFLNGAILGMRKAEIAAKFDEIVAFSEVEKFIDTPVKRYSSGMYVRLAFAVAAHLEPEILLVDEVLAVGDAAFQKKCLGKMDDVAKHGRTILFVSHNMAAVENLCRHCLVLDRGGLTFEGDTNKAIARYLGESRGTNGGALAGRERIGSGEVIGTYLWLSDIHANAIDAVRSGQDVEIHLEFENRTTSAKDDVLVGFRIDTALGATVFLQHNRLTGDEFGVLPRRGGFVCRIPRLPLFPGGYFITFSIMPRGGQDGTYFDNVQYAASFAVVEGDFFGSGRLPPTGYGPCLVDASWRLDPAEVGQIEPGYHEV